MASSKLSALTALAAITLADGFYIDDDDAGVAKRSSYKDVLAEPDSSPSSASGTLILDLDISNVFDVTLTESVTTLTISNIPASGRVAKMILMLTQSGAGSFTVTWPAAVVWPGATAPTLSTPAGDIDIIDLFTNDGGTTWYATLRGLNYS